MRYRWITALTCVLATATPLRADAEEVMVSAAASLANVMQEIARAYESRTGTRVTVNVAASNTLARQIRNGAPVDVFISADEVQMDVVRTEIVPGSRIDLLANQLAIAVPADRPRTLKSARELSEPRFKRIALGDPAAVPAGIYAKTYFEQLGIWAAIQSRVIPCASVRLALAAVENGSADAAVVYRTDVATAHRASMGLVIPANEGPRIVYPAALVRAGRNRDRAIRFLAWLQGKDAEALFRASGFIIPTRDAQGRSNSRPLSQEPAGR